MTEKRNVTRCPSCGVPLDADTVVDGPAGSRPSIGDLTICVYCVKPFTYTSIEPIAIEPVDVEQLEPGDRAALEWARQAVLSWARGRKAARA